MMYGIVRVLRGVPAGVLAVWAAAHWGSAGAAVAVCAMWVYWLRKYLLCEDVFGASLTADDVGPKRGISMAGKVVVVTGASAGIGKECARSFARMGAHVIMAVRNEQKAAGVLAEIRKDTANNQVELMMVDVSDYDSVRAFVRAFNARGLPLHVLVNNAGVSLVHRTLTKQGHCMTMATNYLGGNFLLTNLLLPVLNRTPGARVVCLSSSVHEWVPGVEFDDFMCERSYEMQGFVQYARSKLCIMLFVHEMNKRLRAQGSHVTINAVHPSLVATEMFREMDSQADKIFRIMTGLYIKSAAQGAATAVHCGCAPELAGASGRYYWDTHEHTAGPATHDDAAAARLWAASERYVGGLAL